MNNANTGQAAYGDERSSAPGQPATQSQGLKRKKLGRLPLLLVAIASLILLAAAAMAAWYWNATRPISSTSQEQIQVTIEKNSTPRMIASRLHEEGLIRSQLAFDVYTRLEGLQGQLQAGSYQFSPSQSLGEIVDRLTSGQTSTIELTFYPGGTLYDPTDIADSKRTDVYTVLRRAGFSDEAVRSALSKQYEHPLFAGKPAGTSLEGYVFGETYRFDGGVSAEQVLEHTFDVFYERIVSAGIIEKLDDVDMNLYQAITLASVIEREVSGQLEDQRIVSQIFHRRLEVGEPLGADATFMYVAQQRNVTPNISIDSPYNTRVNKGLPPGPIAAPDMVALEAAVSPADTNYLFFVSGDDGRNHFAKTNAEHEANTRRYCTTLCSNIAP